MPDRETVNIPSQSNDRAAETHITHDLEENR